MLNKLTLIFKKFGFEMSLDTDDLKILQHLSDDKSEYFIIIELIEMKSFLDVQSKYKKVLKEHIKDKEVDKNSTLLICLKSEILPLETNIYKDILRIEEDPYYFRKLVFPYTQEQLSYLDDPDEFKNIIKNVEKFEEFKIECKSKNLTSSHYEIISQLYIKLPFLKLPVVSQGKNIVLDEYKSSLNDDENKVLTFLEDIEIYNISNNEIFFNKLGDLK